MTEVYFDKNLELYAYELPSTLTQSFWSVLKLAGDEISFQEVAVVQKWRKADPRIVSKFSTTAILPDNPKHLSFPFKGFRGGYSMAAGIESEYTEKMYGEWKEQDDPCIDNTIALGLVYHDNGRKRLVAACSGALCVQGFTITQIQDVSRKTNHLLQHDSRVARANGLHSGLDWKQTIVLAMVTMVRDVVPSFVPELAHKPILLRSAENNYWVREGFIPTEQVPNFVRTYDDTARKLDGVVSVESGDFILQSLRLSDLESRN